MGFSPPTYPLLFNAWHSQSILPPIGQPYAVKATCQLSVFKPGSLVAFSGLGIAFATHIMRTPVGFDVRDNWSGLNGAQLPTDLIEVPSGSGNFYWSLLVQAAGLGYTNAHLRVHLARIGPHLLEPQPAIIL